MSGAPRDCRRAMHWKSRDVWLNGPGQSSFQNKSNGHCQLHNDLDPDQPPVEA